MRNSKRLVVFFWGLGLGMLGGALFMALSPGLGVTAGVVGFVLMMWSAWKAGMFEKKGEGKAMKEQLKLDLRSIVCYYVCKRRKCALCPFDAFLKKARRDGEVSADV